MYILTVYAELIVCKCAQIYGILKMNIYMPLSEAVCCCLQTCNFVEIFMLMNVCVQSNKS